MNNNLVIEVAGLLRRYCTDHSKPHEINRLVRLASQIAQQKLWGRLKAASHARELTIDQLAMSIVGALFCNGDSSSNLAKALNDVLESDDITLYLRFHAVVVRTGSQELFHRWKETDPQSAKLWRNLNRALRHDSRFVTIPPDNSEWVSLKSWDDLHGDLPPVDYSEILRFTAESGRSGISLTDHITEILSRIRDNTKSQNIIRIEILFSALREMKSRIQADELKDQAVSTHIDTHLHIAIERANDNVRGKINDILGKYQTTGKLSSKTAAYFGKALYDILKDYADGGLAQSYYHYMNMYWPDLTLEVYRTQHRSRFEYLAEFVKKSFFEEMREQLID